MLRKSLSLVVALIAIATGAYAQTIAVTGLKLGKVAVTPANTAAGTKPSANAMGTRDEILAEPRINLPEQANGHKLTVKSFSISLMPTGGEFFGPFIVDGAELPRNIIQKLREMSNPQGMVYIETIKAYDETDKVLRTLNPIIMKMVTK